MTTLLFVEHGNGQIKDGTLKALTAARTIGASIHALVLGAGSRPVAEAAARLDGIEKVLNAEDGTYDYDLAEPVGALIASLAIAPLMQVPFLFDVKVNLIAFLFSAAIGVVFGCFPARRAAALNPIDALRHE